MLRFLRATGYETNPSVYTMYALERAWEGRGLRPVVNAQSRAEVVLAKTASKLRLMRNLYRSRQGPILVALMGYSESRLLLKCFNNEFIPYCFDCWPPMFDRWEAFFRRHRVRLAMFSARQSAEYFRKCIPEMNSAWIPEALDPSEYHSGTTLSERDIDVLEVGRKYDSYHDAIAGRLHECGISHLYEKVKGTVVFPGKQQLIDGLSRAKISVCFPSSTTHPARSGDVETVTLRYFEAIASRCILVGKCPAELAELFGYNPVAEVEQGREAEQLLEMVAAPDQYQWLVDKNYRRLLEVGTWDRRSGEMLEFIANGLELPVAEELVAALGGKN
jgi:hypothetical protein